MTAHLVTAWVLLSTPPGVKEVPPAVGQWADLSLALRRVAIDQQLMCEDAGYFTALREFQDDLNAIRQRWIELADCPPIQDVMRFPPIGEIREGRYFNQRYKAHLVNRLEWETDRADQIWRVIQETDQLYRIWDAADDGLNPNYGIARQRKGLARLKELLGDDDYAAAKLPPPVPLWRFNEGR
jgi:hypothetical protein